MSLLDIGKAALDLLGSKDVGGIQGLQQLLQQKGLGEVAASWIGTGPNQAISAEQLQKALGPERIAALAQKVGVPPDRAQQALVQFLPQLVDKLTPNGQVPQGQNLAQAGLDALKTLLG